MRGLAAAAVWLATALAGAPAAAEPLPRVAHVTEALAAVRALGPTGRDDLDRAIYAAARTQCHADTAAPSVRCLIAAARSSCTGVTDRAGCAAAADVIVTNLRAATSFVDEATRIRLVRGSTDYRAALAGELHRRYATLAAELVLRGSAGAASDDAAATAVAIDELCGRRDRQLHVCQPGDPACVPSLPWSRCVAALVWFVGGGT